MAVRLEHIERCVGPSTKAGRADRVVEPPARAEYTGAVLRLVRAAAHTADVQIVHVGSGRPRRRARHLGSPVIFEELARQELLVSPIAVVHPEPPDTGEI